MLCNKGTALAGTCNTPIEVKGYGLPPVRRIPAIQHPQGPPERAAFDVLGGKKCVLPEKRQRLNGSSLLIRTSLNSKSSGRDVTDKVTSELANANRDITQPAASASAFFP